MSHKCPHLLGAIMAICPDCIARHFAGDVNTPIHRDINGNSTIMPLFLACDVTKLNIFYLLLDLGADPSTIYSGRSSGESVIAKACRCNLFDVVVLLVKRVPLDTNCLLYAINNDNVDIARLLLENGASVENMFEHVISFEMAELLLRYGAVPPEDEYNADMQFLIDKYKIDPKGVNY